MSPAPPSALTSSFWCTEARLWTKVHGWLFVRLSSVLLCPPSRHSKAVMHAQFVLEVIGPCACPLRRTSAQHSWPLQHPQHSRGRRQALRFCASSSGRDSPSQNTTPDVRESETQQSTAEARSASSAEASSSGGEQRAGGTAWLAAGAVALGAVAFLGAWRCQCDRGFLPKDNRAVCICSPRGLSPGRDDLLGAMAFLTSRRGLLHLSLPCINNISACARASRRGLPLTNSCV